MEKQNINTVILNKDKELKGLKGWLILVGFQLVLGALVFLDKLLTTGANIERNFALVMLIFYLFTIACFFKEKKLFPKLMIILYIGFTVLLTLEYFVLQSVETQKNFWGSLIAGIIWIPYFIRSKRVKNTFIN